MVQSEGWGGQRMVLGMSVLLGFVGVGIVGAIGRNYYREQLKHEVETGNNIAVKTLSSLGREQRLQKARRRRELHGRQ